MPYPESALGQALLLGKRESLPAELVERFRGTGAAHLLAISGLHVGVLLALTVFCGRLAAGEAEANVPGSRGGGYLALRPRRRSLTLGVTGCRDGDGVPDGAGLGPTVQRAACPGAGRRAYDRHIAQLDPASQLSAQLCRRGRDCAGPDSLGRQFRRVAHPVGGLGNATVGMGALAVCRLRGGNAGDMAAGCRHLRRSRAAGSAGVAAGDTGNGPGSRGNDDCRHRRAGVRAARGTAGLDRGCADGIPDWRGFRLPTVDVGSGPGGQAIACRMVRRPGAGVADRAAAQDATLAASGWRMDSPRPKQSGRDRN